MSSERQRASRVGLAAQRRALAASCRRHGWQPLEPAAAADRAEAQRLHATTAGTALLAAKRERLAQALPQLASLLASARQQGWALVALDSTTDTVAPAAEPSVNLLAAFAPCEQQLISKRTRKALANTRAQGVRLGRPPTMHPYVIERIKRERAAGKSLAAIANALNSDHIPTAQGGRRWYPATIRHTLNRTS